MLVLNGEWYWLSAHPVITLELFSSIPTVMINHLWWIGWSNKGTLIGRLLLFLIPLWTIKQVTSLSNTLSLGTSCCCLDFITTILESGSFVPGYMFLFPDFKPLFGPHTPNSRGDNTPFNFPRKEISLQLSVSTPNCTTSPSGHGGYSRNSHFEG